MQRQAGYSQALPSPPHRTAPHLTQRSPSPDGASLLPEIDVSAEPTGKGGGNF